MRIVPVLATMGAMIPPAILLTEMIAMGIEFNTFNLALGIGFFMTSLLCLLANALYGSGEV